MSHAEEQKRYYERNRERINEERRRRYREDGAYRQKARDNARRQAPKNRGSRRRWAEENPEKTAQYKRSYWQKNREKWRAYARRWRALKRGAEGAHSEKDVEDLFVSQRGLCAYCEVALGDGWHVDHMVPLSRGGSNDPSNLALACAPCNWSKGNKTVEEFTEVFV